jgi:peptidoglycan hydrolase CwlO-like protein
MPRSSFPRHAALLAAAILLALLLWAAGPLAAGGAQTPETLQRGIDGSKARERSLASAAQRLGDLERALAKDISVLQSRLASVHGELGQEQTRLADTQAGLRAQRARSQRLAKRLAHGRVVLARRLRDQYTASRPDLITVVLAARNLPDLLEQAEFLRRIQRSDERIVGDVRDARDASRTQARRLAVLEQRQRDSVLAIQRREAALASMNAALDARRSALAHARAARLEALQATRAGRRRAERELQRLLAQRARAASALAASVSVSTSSTGSAGPGGPWSIPWAIVQCESGGQNLPPNAAGASGYYQFLDSTWHGLGGSTPHAYQAGKAEQDRLAAALWNGGSGSGNWDCAALVAL